LFKEKTHHEGPSAAKPQPNLGIFPANARRRKGFEEKKFFSELGVFAPSRENDPTPRCFPCRTICASRANFSETENSDSEIPLAKTPSAPSSKLLFPFAAFPLRQGFGEWSEAFSEGAFAGDIPRFGLSRDGTPRRAAPRMENGKDS
jgi:hypothetical protein